MATVERDSTQEWLLPENARPPLLSELEERIDEAMATAKATESAVVTIGAAAIDAAEQARYAAELAERASAALFARGPAPAGAAERREDAPAASDGEDLADFNARADRLAARLERINTGQQPPLEM
jgi:hypothetical protein